jgi:hypothetical protein
MKSTRNSCVFVLAYQPGSSTVHTVLNTMRWVLCLSHLVPDLLNKENLISKNVSNSKQCHLISHSPSEYAWVGGS